MAINWSTVPLISCLLTVLIEWQVAARLKIIFLGEQLLSLLVSSPVFSPELGLFSTDVVTDWINGYNLYQDGHVIWGSLTAALPFLPIHDPPFFRSWSLNLYSALHVICVGHRLCQSLET